MTTEFRNLLNEKGFTNFAFSTWYYTRTLPSVVYGKKYYMVYNGKLVAFKILECAYVGVGKNSWGGDNKWVAHAVIAGEGHKAMYLSYFADNKIFASVESYEAYVKTQDDDNCILLGEDESNRYLKFGEYFYFKLGYRNGNEGTWNRYLAGYIAKKGELKAHTTPVVIDCLWTDADGVHLQTNNNSRYSSNEEVCFTTELKALENAKISEVVDFDDFEEEENKLVEVEININVKATTKENALEKIMETLDKEFA